MNSEKSNEKNEEMDKNISNVNDLNLTNNTNKKDNSKDGGLNLIEIDTSKEDKKKIYLNLEGVVKDDSDKSLFDWKKELQNNLLFSQDIEYNYIKLLEYMKKTNENLNLINPLFFFLAVYEFTKALKILSTALKYAFSDITEKVEICRVIFRDFFPQFDNLQELMLYEISINLHSLNGDNNSDYGHKKKTKYYEYQSLTRTILRILWFLQYIFEMFKYIQTTNDKLCDIMVKTYDEVLAPHHGWIIRKSAQIALGFAPDDRKPLFEGFFGKIYFYLKIFIDFRIRIYKNKPFIL